MPYDPDGDPDDFDDTDPAALQEWFDHPNTRALHDDLGRDFRTRPPAEQVAELEPQLAAAVQRRDQLAAIVAASDSPDDDSRLPLLRACEQQVQALADRIAELRAELD